MGSILKVKRPNGSIANIPIISGESAYETAVRLGSYDGTEQEFAEGLAAAAEIGDAITLPPTGSTIKPIYIDNNHNIQPITHTIESDVPSNAKFTDTNTTYTVQTNGGLGMTGTSFYLADIAGLTSGTIGDNTTTTLNFGDTIKIPKLTINSKGQTTSIEDISLTLPSAPTTYVLPTASSSTLGGVKTGASLSSTSGYTACPIDSNGTIYYKDAPTTYTLPTASSSTLGGVKTGTSLSNTTGYTACPVDSNGTIYYKNINIPKFNLTFNNVYFDNDYKGFEVDSDDITNFINYIDNFFVNSNPDITNNTNTLDDNIYLELYITGIPVKLSYGMNGPIFTSGTSTIKFNCIYETDNNDRYITGTFTQVQERNLVTYYISFNIQDTEADSYILVAGEIQSLANLDLSRASSNTTGF